VKQAGHAGNTQGLRSPSRAHVLYLSTHEYFPIFVGNKFRDLVKFRTNRLVPVRLFNGVPWRRNEAVLDAENPVWNSLVPAVTFSSHHQFARGSFFA
jgi:hypothetical protein